jgi:hypothetical protein
MRSQYLKCWTVLYITRILPENENYGYVPVISITGELILLTTPLCSIQGLSADITVNHNKNVEPATIVARGLAPSTAAKRILVRIFSIISISLFYLHDFLFASEFCRMIN